MIKGSIAVGTETGMKFLSKYSPGGYPLLSFDSWEHLVEWGKKREEEVRKERPLTGDEVIISV